MTNRKADGMHFGQVIGVHIGELMTMLKPEDFDKSLGQGSKVLPVGSTVWPVQGKNLASLWTSKGVLLKKPVVIEFATWVPMWCVKKMSYFYGNPKYALLWFKDPLPKGTSQVTYGMVYEVSQARDIGDFMSQAPDARVWHH